MIPFFRRYASIRMVKKAGIGIHRAHRAPCLHIIFEVEERNSLSSHCMCVNRKLSVGDPGPWRL